MRWRMCLDTRVLHGFADVMLGPFGKHSSRSSSNSSGSSRSTSSCSSSSSSNSSSIRRYCEHRIRDRQYKY